MSGVLNREQFLKLTGVEPYELSRWSHYGIIPRPANRMPVSYHQETAIAVIVTRELRVRTFWMTAIRRLVPAAVKAYRDAQPEAAKTAYLVVTSSGSPQRKHHTARAHAVPRGELWKFLQAQTTGAMLIDLAAIARRVDAYYRVNAVPV